MRKLAAVLFILLLGAAAGFVYERQQRPFSLNYRRAAINLPITYAKYLKDDKYALGEKYLAEDMAAVLAQYGVEAALFSFEDTFSNRNFRAGYEIYMRPGPELRSYHYHDLFDEDRIAVLIETIPYEEKELRNADLIFTGSPKRNREYRQKGLNSYFLPQFTRFDKFLFAPRPGLKRKILFVANQWPKMPVRKSVDYALKNGIPIDVFGANWEDVLTGQAKTMWKGQQVAGDDLKYYYSSADIVLNDTRPDMIEAGFISNRIFDVTACKGFIISDYMAEIEEIYGDAVPMYHNEEEFKALIEYYLAHPEERRQKAEQAYQITKERFGADKVIGEMFAVMEEYRRQHGLGGDE